MQALNTVYANWARDAHSAGITKPRILAYAAVASQDPALGERAWQLLRDSLKRDDGSDRFPATLTAIEGPEAPEPVLEIPHVDTPGTAQWALNILVTTEVARDFYTPPASPPTT